MANNTALNYYDNKPQIRKRIHFIKKKHITKEPDIILLSEMSAISKLAQTSCKSRDPFRKMSNAFQLAVGIMRHCEQTLKPDLNMVKLKYEVL